jgi:hypothetical protein
MEDRELCQLLEELHDELEATKSANEKERKLLYELKDDISELLERCEEEPLSTDPQKIRRLEDAVEYMAVNHPGLTAMLSRMSTILNNAGV